ncbi:MAG: TetR/AcrR family transcriptional regulator [Chloroflexota bacterium]
MTSTSKKDIILDAALDLFVDHDIQATAMSKIAKKANTGMGTIYNYFESKDVLLEEIYLRSRRKLKQAIFNSFPADGSYQERFFHVWRMLCQYFITHPKEFMFGERLMVSPYYTPALRDENATLWVPIEEMFFEAREQGAIKDIPLELFLPMVGGAFGAVVKNHIAGIHELDAEAIEFVINNFWDSVKLN